MSTGNFQDFTGEMTEIGPLYPFVESEWFLSLLCLVFWLAWHFWQMRLEIRQLGEDATKHARQEILDRVHKKEEADTSL